VPLISLATKAQVCTLLGRLAVPGDSRLYTTDRDTGGGRVHLSQVNHLVVDLHQELVAGAPVVDLVQGKLNGNLVGFHGNWAGASGNGDGLGHLQATSSQPS